MAENDWEQELAEEVAGGLVGDGRAVALGVAFAALTVTVRRVGGLIDPGVERSGDKGAAVESAVGEDVEFLCSCEWDVRRASTGHIECRH
ncbi:MAG TPA: hypothetical protein VM009_07475 [Terriglobales bacterium]|nr:hypothetical protein [Terriglobales bacterium]